MIKMIVLDYDDTLTTHHHFLPDLVGDWHEFVPDEEELRTPELCLIAKK